MRGICMLLVILHHSNAPYLYQKFLSPFFLSGFFFISGYLFDNPSVKFSRKYKLVRIIETLIIPYFIYWTLSYFIKNGYYEIYLKGNWDIFIPFIKQLLYGEKLWFISSLIVSEVILTIIFPYIRKMSVLLLTTLVFIAIWCLTPLSNPVFYPWYINCACATMPFIILGVIVRHVNIKKIDKYLICSVYLYLILFLLDINFDINHFVIAANYYNDFFVFVIYAIIGVFALMSVCKKYLYSNNIVLSFFGKNSLLVYFFCNQIIILCVKLTSPLDINWYVKSLVILVLAGLILPILVFVSNTFLPWMSGKFNYLSSYCLK